MMKAVLDTTSIIFLNDFRMFEEIYTVSEVVDEVKDKINSMKFSGMELKISEPSENSLKYVRNAAKETGDNTKLSDTDVRVIALAKDKSLTIISDDYAIQNVAEKLKIEYISLNKGITKQIEWKMYCTSCRKFYEKENSCPVCGESLVRRKISEKFIKGKSN